MNIITTPRLFLIPATKKILKAALINNTSFSEHLNVNIDDNWTEYGNIVIQYVLNRLNETPGQEDWWTYFPVLKETNTLIGNGGYKGPPDINGVVEIGYEIAPAYRRKGLATEFARGLIDHAFSFNSVNSIIAHTLTEINPSTRLLISCGFSKVEELSDPEVGSIWKWELRRD